MLNKQLYYITNIHHASRWAVDEDIFVGMIGTFVIEQKGLPYFKDKTWVNGIFTPLKIYSVDPIYFSQGVYMGAVKLKRLVGKNAK